MTFLLVRIIPSLPPILLDFKPSGDEKDLDYKSYLTYAESTVYCVVYSTISKKSIQYCHQVLEKLRYKVKNLLVL